MERLTFGFRARRRARRQRILRRAAFVSLAAMAIGVPGATAGVELVERLIGPGATRAAAGIETTESTAGLLRFRNKVVEARPEETLTPTPDAPFIPSTSIEQAIADAANEFGLDSGYLLSVAECESSLNPGAVSPAGYYGLFQFDQTTWAAYGYGSIYDVVAQARTTARLIAAGQGERWPNCA